MYMIIRGRELLWKRALESRTRTGKSGEGGRRAKFRARMKGRGANATRPTYASSAGLNCRYLAARSCHLHVSREFYTKGSTTQASEKITIQTIAARQLIKRDIPPK